MEVTCILFFDVYAYYIQMSTPTSRNVAKYVVTKHVRNLQVCVLHWYEIHHILQGCLCAPLNIIVCIYTPIRLVLITWHDGYVACHRMRISNISELYFIEMKYGHCWNAD